MKAYLQEFFELFAYPEEARTALEQAYDAIAAQGALKDEFEALLQHYEKDKNCDFRLILDPMDIVSDRAGIHRYTGRLLLQICMCGTLKEYYREEGVDEQIWYFSVQDLKWKMIECKCVHDIWGTFLDTWFQGFFRMTRFCFEKLEFELVPFGRNYEKNGVVLTPESIVAKTHIPRTGTKLDKESKNRSYEMAAKFFRERYHLDPVVFVCGSWFLFPRNKEVLSPESNLYAFISDYDVIQHWEYEDYSQVWRLFDRNYEGDVDKLPQDTSLRRAYADWIRKGIRTGAGYGVYVFQPR